MKLVHWRWCVCCYIWYSQEGPGWGRCTKCNSPPVNGQCTNTVLLYNGPVLCGFNVLVEGLRLTLRVIWTRLYSHAPGCCSWPRDVTLHRWVTVVHADLIGRWCCRFCDDRILGNCLPCCRRCCNNRQHLKHVGSWWVWLFHCLCRTSDCNIKFS